MTATSYGEATPKRAWFQKREGGGLGEADMRKREDQA
jgi:hypothetical protein